MNRASGVVSVYQWTDLFIYSFKKKRGVKASSLLSAAVFRRSVFWKSCELCHLPVTNSQQLQHQPQQQNVGLIFLMYKNKQTKPM